MVIGFGVFAVNLAVTLATVRDRGLTWWALAGVAVFLASGAGAYVTGQMIAVDGGFSVH